MQAGRLQGINDELKSVRQELRRFQKQLRQELAKDAPNETILDRLERAIAQLVAEQQQLLDERKVLKTQPEGEQWGTAPDAWPTLYWAHSASWGQRTIATQAVAVAAVVHLLSSTAPAEVRAMRAMGHLLAQAACIDLHAAHHALQKPLVPAATSSPCQVTARHDGRAAPSNFGPTLVSR